MCGLIGLLTNRTLSTDALWAMTSSLPHRGPKDEGVWVDAAAGINLAVQTEGYKLQVKVSTMTLDDLTRNVESIALIKMDLEGAEPQALRGAPATRPLIMESRESVGGKAVEILRAQGFAIEPIDSSNIRARRV